MRPPGLLGALIADGLASGRVVRFCATGSSMHPTIRDGESIAVAPVAIERIVAGDVLLCQRRRRLLAHRVVRVMQHDGTRRFELRGDAMAACDPAVSADAVVGKVVAVWRNGRPAAVRGRVARLRRAAGAVASLARPAVWADSVYHPVMSRLDRAVAILIHSVGAR